MVTDKRIRTGPRDPASVIEVLQRGDTTIEAEKRIPECGGIAEPSKQGEDKTQNPE
jgi:hypothetical protein